MQRTVEETDTIGMWFWYADQPGKEIPFADTVMHAPDYYDPTRRQPLTQGHLGFLGTPTRLHLQPFGTATPGFDAGYHACDAYAMSDHQRRFFTLQRPLTYLYYTQGARQADAQFEGFIARDLANDVKLILEYKRITNSSTPDLPLNGNFSYDQPSGNLRSLHVGVARMGQHRYNGIYSFLTATGSFEETGGLISDAGIIENASTSLGQTPVHLSRAGTRFDRYHAIGKHIYKIGALESPFQVTLDQDYNFFRQRYSDSAPDTSFYPAAYQTDVRGLRHYLQGYGAKHRAMVQSVWRPRGKEGRFAAGAAHHAHLLQYDNSDSLIQNLWVIGELILPIFNNLLLESTAGLNTAFDNAGDYYLTARLNLPIGTWANLQGTYRSQLAAPSLVAHRADISGRALWRNAFSKTLTNKLQATLQLPRWHVQGGIDYQLVNNLIYWDTLARPQQTSLPVSILGLWVAQQWRWRFVHLDGQITARTTSEPDIVPMPRLSWQADIYAQWPLFKRVLTTRSGLMWHGQSAWSGLAWQPAVGQFHLNPDSPLGNVPRVDFYAQFSHVKQFRFFVAYTHAATFIQRNLYNETAGYPMPDRYLRLGVSTLLRY